MKTFKTLVLSTLLTSGLSTLTMAENSGVYTSIGFQYSQLKLTTTNTDRVRNPSPALVDVIPNRITMGNMYGFGINIGYKHFFGKEKRNGLRYYAFYDYAYSNPYYNNSQDNLGHTNNNVYGVGFDYLFNFVNKDDIQAGLFFGVAIAGSSWSSAMQSQGTCAKNDDYCRNNFTYVQVPLQWGIRTNVSKHNGFEIGMKVPLVQNYWLKVGSQKGANGDTLASVTYKRSVVFYLNYVYSF
ncbi:outer membrane protein [Helicobacter cetorum]|uniref:outer membrane protein n=1 Tax=Helicobacter cetorum TaxID=138563 RepID=UPI001315A066|nr:outer membrane protein [Helicobacter cetorum]